MKKPWLSIGPVLVVAAVLLLSACSAQPDGQTPAAASSVGSARAGKEGESRSSSGWDLSARRNSAGWVEIEVTPLALTDDAWEFQVAFDTHSVDLGFDLTEVGWLRCDQGQEFEAVAWDGSGPGGHHRSGVLTFAALDHPTSFVEVVIRDVARVPERVFRWDVPQEARTAADSDVTQVVTSEARSTTTDGPARVALSDQEFHFGDVVMSLGAVEQTMDITNTGGGVLRIEGVHPT